MSAAPAKRPPHTPKNTARKPRKSIKLDRVNPGDFLKQNMVYCCEQCSHYDIETDRCTLGYQASVHKRDLQLKRFYSTSHMAFCRFIEID